MKSPQLRVALGYLNVAGLLTWANWVLIPGIDWYSPLGKVLRWPIGFIICSDLSGHSPSSQKTACMYWLLITALFKFWGLLIFLNYLFRNRLSTFLMKPKNGNWLACVCTFLLALLMNANVLGLGGIALNACIGLSIFGISWTPFGWPARILLALPFWFGWTVWLQQGTEDGVVIVLPILSFVLYSVSLKERASFGAMDRVASGPTV